MIKPNLPRAALALALAQALPALAQPPASSPYFTDHQDSYVEDATSRGIGQVNMITCIMAAMRPDATVNDGPYRALVDQAKCDPQAKSSNANSGAQTAAFVTATVNSTRASNSEPARARIWLDDPEGEGALIHVNLSATAAPSSTNAYGEFRLDYCGSMEGDTTCLSNGFLEGTPTGISYYELEQGDGGNGEKALRMTASSPTSGAGNLHILEGGGGNEALFAFAYNADYYRREDDSGDQCFARDAQDPDTGMSVWRYGMYDATTGERVERESGFPVEYTNDGTKYQGFLGYWGLSLPAPALETLATGSTIERVEYVDGDDPTRTPYTVVKSGGKLTKYTKHEKTLHEIDKIKFSTFVGNEASGFFSGAQPNVQYEMYWDNSAGDFKVTAQMMCGNNGCSTEPLNPVQSVLASFWSARGGIQGYSPSLGGEVFVDLNGVSGAVVSDDVHVTYRSQDTVYPADIPVQLHCLRDCPTGASLDAFFAENSQENSPYVAGTANNFQPTAVGAVVNYSGYPQDAMLLDGAAQPVVLDGVDEDTLGQYPMFMNGVRSGKLFANLGDAECATNSGTYCEYKVNSLDVYYQWETGANSYNQFVGVKDSSGEFVTLDAPLQVSFHVPSGAAYGQYANQDIVLQYGGFGDLWGIPGICVSALTNAEVSCSTENARYVPSFVVPFDAQVGSVTAGDETYLVKWLQREIRFARKSLSVCNSAGLVVPTSTVLPTSADLRNPSDPNSSIYIGTRPVVTDAPRVIQGEVKY